LEQGSAEEEEERYFQEYSSNVLRKKMRNGPRKRWWFAGPSEQRKCEEKGEEKLSNISFLEVSCPLASSWGGKIF